MYCATCLNTHSSLILSHTEGTVSNKLWRKTSKTVGSKKLTLARVLLAWPVTDMLHNCNATFAWF